MNSVEKDLLDQIEKMAEQAPGVGLCSLPFRILHTRVLALIHENDTLKQELRLCTQEK